MRGNSTDLSEICELLGVSTYYYDIWGNLRKVPEDTLDLIIKSLGYEYQDRWEIFEKFKFSIRNVLKTKGKNLYLEIISLDRPQKLEWTIITEDKREINGNDKNMNVELETAGYIERYVIRIDLGDKIEFGYHLLNLIVNGKEYNQILIYAPDTCYIDQNLFEKNKAFGLSIQLYSIKGPNNLGIGELKDLRDMGDLLKGLPLRVIGLNPLHILFPYDPTQVSPYSPCSRLFLNPLYLGFQDLDIEVSGEAKKILEDIFNQIHKREQEEVQYVQYERIWPQKERLLRVLYENFMENHVLKNTFLAQEFEVYKKKKKDLLAHFAIFLALNEWFKKTKGLYCWKEWSYDYQNPFSETVKKWTEDNQSLVQYYQYLCWITDRAFIHTKRYLNAKGIYLYTDLPVGVSGCGFEPWYWQDLFAHEMSIGAPPDEFNPNGQNWGLPPINPHELKDLHFSAFIETIKNNMEKADILRLDHIMGLMRLFWIPNGKEPSEGAYVRYPMEELFAILCLESHRNKCMVVGEDLGTVPEEVREIMGHKKIFSSSVFLFEKEGHRYKLPGEYREYSVATITTHDLPTLRGFWELRDIELRKRLNLFKDSALEQLHISSRESDKKAILSMLKEAGFLGNDTVDDELLNNYSGEILKAVHRFLIRTTSKITLFQIEDLIGEIDQKNLPGTTSEYPNWRLRLPIFFDEFFKSDIFLWLIQEINNQVKSHITD